MIVMGACTHSRVREMFLGGVPRHVLAHAIVPVIMAH
jgi:nucleotide-binding universal stress UspA family protein